MNYQIIEENDQDDVKSGEHEIADTAEDAFKRLMQEPSKEEDEEDVLS